MSIQILSDLVISQIAAGEVIERPSSVVKELVENALDAEADTISIAIKGGGRGLIRVSDNGSGIIAGEVELAFTRHATSKLRTVDDLSLLGTLGFRGEALASISAVSRMQLATRHREEKFGTQLHINGAELIQKQAVGAPAGTVISVENLFFNTPARLKFLKKESTEKRQITSLVTRYAMAYPHIRFTLDHDDREVFRSSGSGQLADVIVRTLGLDNFKQMVEIEAEQSAVDDQPSMRVQGYTSLAKYNRADRTHITLFVNGRWIQDSSLTYAVVQAYHTLLPTSRFPVSIIMIELPPHEVDVNVHPTKAEVRFRNASAVFTMVQRAVRQAVITATQNPALQENRHYYRESQDSSSFQTEQWNPGLYDSPQMAMNLTFDEPAQGISHSADQDWEDYDPDDPRAIPTGIGAPKKPRTLPMLRVVGQIGAMYIVAEGPAGMYLIDQRAAHERVLYEEILDILQANDALEQVEIDGQSIELEKRDARLVEQWGNQFNALAIRIESFGPNTFVVRALPKILQHTDSIALIQTILKDLRQSQAPDDEFQDIVLRAIAQSASVKSGQILAPEQLQDLVRQLERVRSPHTCPNGRPTMIHMSGDQLAREFRRT